MTRTTPWHVTGSGRLLRPWGSALASSVVAVLLFSVSTPGSLPGQTKSIPQQDRFGLFAVPFQVLAVNRVVCPVNNFGSICHNPHYSTPQHWPKGTVNTYIFLSGLQLAGIVGPNGGPWAGDTTGAFFVDTKGTTEHGRAVTPIVNHAVASDRAQWPVPALVPDNGLFHPSLVGTASASDGDVWWLMWEGNPVFNAGRPHPLGILVEGRALGWNASGIEDIVFVVYTFYNVTSLDEADYLSAPAAMRPVLVAQASEFHALNNTAFGITLPAGGYSVTRFHTAIANDNDVTFDAGSNYAGVTLPMSLAFTWHESFPLLSSWTFDPGIFSPPFFAGTGFVGSTFLLGPDGSADTQLYGNTINGGPFGDAQNTTQLYRYLSGTMNTAAGDAPCNNGDPTVTRVCFVNNASSADIRDFHSTPGVDLAPGQSTSLVMAYLFAAPVADAVYQPGSSLPPGDRTIHGDPTRMAAGVADVDKLAGYLGFSDADGDGVVTGYEYRTVPLSLYGKAQLAQAFFDNGFLVPQAPAAPEFFLIPGNDQVTVMWRPSASELTGDPFFDVARDASRPPPGGGPAIANLLYDPNYREFDVEGYRVYRGRVDDPDALELVAQFDYAGTTIDDFGGQINVSRFCAPELAITTQCPITYDSIAPGLARSAHVSIPLDGRFGSIPFIQVRFGDRSALPDGSAIVHRADTALVGTGTGVPFLWADDQVRNSFRYFYAVTAFDVNSWQSGPASLESPRITKPVVPVKPATNYQNSATVTQGIYGRDVLLDHTSPAPTLDAATGKFSGPFPASNAWTIGLTGLVSEVLSGSGGVVVRLDSLRLGSPYNSPAVAHQYWYTGSSPSTSVKLMIPITQPLEIGLRSGAAQLPSVFVDGSLAARYGGDGSYSIPGAMGISMEGPDYHSLYGRGCVNSRDGFNSTGTSRQCAYNGSRWFDGPSPAMNEVMDHPIGANVANFSGNSMSANYSNAGRLTGVTLIHNTQAYQSVGSGEFRPMEGIKSGARRAADFNVYWGSGGTIDSIIDITHNVVVPFAADHLGGTWGILNPSETATDPAGSYDQRPELTNTDFHCVPPVNDISTHDPGDAECQGAVFTLSQTAIPGPIVPFSQGLAASQTDPVWSDPGFGLYLSGDIFTIGLAIGTVPSAGRVWSLRTYIGAINGGVGAGGDYGPYTFNMFLAGTVVPRSWTAVGTEIRVSFDVVNQVNAPTADDLSNVHPVPDPFYFRSDFDEPEVIRFINLPQRAIIRIYSTSGVLVTLLEHASTTFGGEAQWNVRNRGGTRVAPGVYFYHIESNEARRVGRMLVVSERR